MQSNRWVNLLVFALPILTALGMLGGGFYYVTQQSAAATVAEAP